MAGRGPLILVAAFALIGGLLAFGVERAALGSTAGAEQGGIFRVSFAGGDFDYVDPALAYGSGSWAVLDTTCARLMTYPDKAPPEGLRLVPEVAADFPRISRNGKTHTFTLRSGFRFSDGTPVRASAFARAINRTLAPGVESGGVQYTGDIVGAADVQSGKTQAAAGVTARGNTLIVRFTRPVVNFAAMTTMPFFCAVPPTLHSDPEGVRVFPSAGPYVITEYRPGERVTIRRNRFYRGTRPHHVDGFDVDLRATRQGEVLDRVERGEADWGTALAAGLLRAGARTGREVRRQQIAVLRPAGLHLQAHRLQQLTPASPPGWALLDTTCARLMAYPDKPPPAGFRLEPEVAASFPTVSRDGTTYTFRLRGGFRFSDGTAVRASAYARAINRMLAPGMNSPGVLYARDIVGAGRVLAGQAATAAGVVARGNTLVIRLTRPTPDFPHRTASTFFCAVPPSLPDRPRGHRCLPGRRSLLRVRNTGAANESCSGRIGTTEVAGLTT